MSEVPAPVENAAKESKTKPKGNGSAKKAQDAFRKKKNAQFQAELQATLLKRLHVTDPTNLNSVQLRSSIIPTRIPITFCGLPRIVQELWARMMAVGTRPFSMLATDVNYAKFLKCIMFIAETKVIYAQMKCEACPPFPLTSLNKLTEMQLRTVRSHSSRLPYPLVIFMEAIGNFVIRKQPVVPVEMVTAPDAASGAVSFFPTSIMVLLEACRNYQPVDNNLSTLAKLLDLPNISWEETVQTCPAVAATTSSAAVPERSFNVVKVSEESINFWKFPTKSEWLIFSQIIAAFEIKKGFLLQFDPTSGQGSSLQIVRFPEQYDPDEDETLYYMNDEIPEFEEKLASALLLGLEHFANKSGRFSSDYSESYKHGSSSQSETRHAVIWADH